MPVKLEEEAPWLHEALKIAGWTASVMLLFLTALHTANSILAMCNCYRTATVAMHICLGAGAVLVLSMFATACDAGWSFMLFLLLILFCLIGIVAGIVCFFLCAAIPHGAQITGCAAFMAVVALSISFRTAGKYMSEQELKR